MGPDEVFPRASNAMFEIRRCQPALAAVAVHPSDITVYNGLTYLIISPASYIDPSVYGERVLNLRKNNLTIPISAGTAENSLRRVSFVVA
jgi:hypothetical protein